MAISYHQNLNRNAYIPPSPAFCAGNGTETPVSLAKPIDTVQKSIETSVDTFVKKIDKEKEKKSNKTAITVASSVIVVAGLVALLNPKYSSKLMTNLKNLSHNTGSKIENSKNSFLKTNFYKASKKTIDSCIRVLQFSNNINSAKDVGFKYLCCEKKQFNSIKNKPLKNFLQKVDNGFTSVMKKIHETITKWFDSISKYTVKSKYNKATKRMDALERLINQYKNKLSPAEQQQLETKLKEIKEARTYFSKDNTYQRLSEQESMMENLEKDFIEKLKAYRNGFSNKSIKNSTHINQNLTFWAEEIMQPTRNNVEAQGLAQVEKFIGNNKGQKGLYNEVYEILSPHINKEESVILEKSIGKVSKTLRKANHSECVEYFDKKRDLVLGGAPTDIVTAVAGLGLSGVAIATADSKEDRISRALTGGFPIVAGIGASMAFTAMLFSGIQGILLGAGTSIALSKIGSFANHKFLAHVQNEKKHNTTNNPFQPQEVMHA